MTRLSPRFAADVEAKYYLYRQEGLTQTHRVFCACCTLYFALWLTYAGSSILDQETFRTAAYGLTTVTGLNWLVLLALYCSPTAKAHSDAVFTGTCAIMVSVATWTLPLTQQDAPKDVFDLVNRESGLLQGGLSCANYDLDEMQALFITLGYAAVFCRIGPGWYLLLCVVTFTNFIASNWYWKNWGGSNILRELPKMGLCIFIFYAGVRRTDMTLRREFAARTLLLLLLKEQHHSLSRVKTQHEADVSVGEMMRKEILREHRERRRMLDKVLGLERRVTHLTKELEAARKALQSSKRASSNRSEASEFDPSACQQLP